MDQDLKEFVSLIDAAERIVLFTGAGISTNPAFPTSAVQVASGPSRRRLISPTSCAPTRRGAKPGAGVSRWSLFCVRRLRTAAIERWRN